ncbi:HIT domain-containing protein [Paenibacillus silvae]|uniref:HIT domain-containing protein n=1 Tax=Paenibacillus TaxID=44249 RepID=UPI001C0F973A|nr:MULTISPECIES: HIT domain-containing protein [Paenibacillus]MBU5351106.1 HIT domain-containing protein [Paenibacillus barcinonensis]MDM5278268.1 HIT domain-containing protein [Paenibacillus silvae]
MVKDFYCDKVLSGKIEVSKVIETEKVLAYHHTRPFYEHHIVVIPKVHVQSLISEEEDNNENLLLELMKVIKKVASEMTSNTGSSKIITNVGTYQDTKHLHWHVVSGDKIR